jgi:hypothetical protein
MDLHFSRWQYEALVRCDHYKILNLIGGRGSGKSFIEGPRVIRWMKLSTELYWGIFGATDMVLNTIMAPVTDLLTVMGLEWWYEKQPPPGLRTSWALQGIRVPPPRLRQHKILVVENGLHVVTGSLVNGAYTRFKSIEFNRIYIGESTEPGVTKNAILTLLGASRCGKATKGDDGVWRCREQGHIHGLDMAGNVPLNDPSHFIYRFDEQLRKREAKRLEEGKPPFYRLINSATKDNPHTGADYDEMLQSAMDEQTYIQQTSGKLTRNVSALTYYAFSDQNITDKLVYDPKRPLHIWFDFNNAPATAGWGHDLRLDEVPEIDRREGGPYHYFGINGELFSGTNAMQTEQVAYALLEDRKYADATKDARCLDCRCPMKEHMELTGSGHMCRMCMHRTSLDPKRFCSGEVFRDVTADDQPPAARFIHAHPNWRGLLNHRADIFVYGDASGKATHADASVVGGSRRILKLIFEEALGERVHFRFKESNPNITHRLAAVNRGFMSGTKVRSVFIAPHCTAHIADFREVVPDPKTNEPMKISMPKGLSDPDHYSMRTHSSDGFGYHLDYRFPFRPPKADEMPWVNDASDTGPFATDWPRP